MSNDAKDFLDDMAGYVADPSPINRIGTIDSAYSSGRPRVLFDGETVLGAKLYPYVGSYVPKASHRVVLAPVGSSYVILGVLDSVARPATASYGTLDFTGTTSINQGNTSELSRIGDLVTLNAYIGLGANGAPAGATIAHVPVGYRPKNSRASVWGVWASAGWKGTAAMEIGTDGSIMAKWLSTAAAANDGIFGSISYVGA